MSDKEDYEMNRDRAKKLLPIIQAYAEGKTIQYKYMGVGFENWHDVDNELEEIDNMRYKYRIKPESKYNEIFKLKSLLEENHIPFEWIEHNDFRNGYQICYPVKSEKPVCSVVEHLFSYGSQKDLLEIQGLLTAEEEEEEYDSVLGNLTADNVFQRILSHWEKINRIKPEEDGEITSVEELKEAIFSKKQEISARGGDGSLFLYITISENMVKAIEERYSCVFRTDKGCVNTFLGIPFVAGDKTKVEIKDRLVELLKKEHTAYRPFKSCDELIETWKNMMNKVLGVNQSFIKTDLDEPTVWVKQKIDGRRRMIVGFGDNFVEVGVKAKPITLERMFEMYTFFDGSPCGVSNGKEKSDSEN